MIEKPEGRRHAHIRVFHVGNKYILVPTREKDTKSVMMMNTRTTMQAEMIKMEKLPDVVSSEEEKHFVETNIENHTIVVF